MLPAVHAHVMPEVDAWLHRRFDACFCHDWEMLEKPYKDFWLPNKLPDIGLVGKLPDSNVSPQLPWFGLSECSLGWTPYHCLLWLGGAYAKKLDLFDTRQATAEWIYTRIRPLGIQPPKAAWKGLCKSLSTGDLFCFRSAMEGVSMAGPGAGPGGRALPS